jgi:hypothetical protein
VLVKEGAQALSGEEGQEEEPAQLKEQRKDQIEGKATLAGEEQNGTEGNPEDAEDIGEGGIEEGGSGIASSGARKGNGTGDGCGKEGEEDETAGEGLVEEQLEGQGERQEKERCEEKDTGLNKGVETKRAESPGQLTGGKAETLEEEDQHDAQFTEKIGPEKAIGSPGPRPDKGEEQGR